MADLQSIFNNKRNFINLLLSDEELVKSLVNNEKNFLSIPVPDTSTVVFNHIFPCKYIPEVAEESKTFISMEFSYRQSKNTTYFRANTVTFYIFCAVNLIQTDYEMLRYDFILHHIDKMMRDSRSAEWIGKMEFDECKDLILDQRGKYVGVAAAYRSVEFA